MTEVVSVKFKNRGKTYYFDPAGIQVPDGASVIVETSKGLELAQCSYGNHYTDDKGIVPPLRPVVRIATENDLRVADMNRKREQEAFEICQKKIAEHGLDMKLVDVECNFEGTKTMFFFTSDGRVDFRELVKDLAAIFRNRIELRQIGVRDEAKMLGGIGICGRPFCCSQFLDDFQPVSTKMAKMQSMSLNPTKISGNCGRLMCCLRYEEEAYEDLVKTVPKSGAYVETPAGYGSVTQVNLLRRTVKVRIDGDGEAVIKAYSADDVATVPGGRPKPGETPPHVLKPKEAEPAEEPETDIWAAPQMLISDAKDAQENVPRRKDGESHSGNNNGSRRRRRGGGTAQGGDKPRQTGEKPKQDKKPQDARPKTGEQTPAQRKPHSEAKPRQERRPEGQQQANPNPRSRNYRNKKPSNRPNQPKPKKEQKAEE